MTLGLFSFFTFFLPFFFLGDFERLLLLREAVFGRLRTVLRPRGDFGGLLGSGGSGRRGRIGAKSPRVVSLQLPLTTPPSFFGPVRSTAFTARLWLTPYYILAFV